MSEQPSFWQRLFGGAEASSLSQRQQKVMRYLIERMDKGEVPLQQALQEDYVRRNLSRATPRPHLMLTDGNAPTVLLTRKEGSPRWEATR